MAPRIDVIGGAICSGIALAGLYQAADLDTGTLRSFGPGMLPTILAAILLTCGLALLVVGLTQKGAAAERLRVTLRGPGLVGIAILVFALTIEGTQIGALSIPRLGLAVVGPLTLILAGYATAEAELRDLAAAGFGLTAFCLALFNDILGMDIPVAPGALEAALGAETLLRGAYGLLTVLAILLAVLRPAPDEHG
jgi:hypothetical protein